MLDDKDTKIIAELKQNSRLSIREIAKKTGLRPSTVHKRIQTLVKTKVIEKFTVKFDNKAVDENFIAFVLVKTKPGTLIDSKLLQHEHVKEVFGITGDFDLMIKTKFKDLEEFNKFIIMFRKDPSVETTNTLIVTLNLKEEI